MEIIPAVLEKTEEDFIKKVSFLPPEAKFIHIDVLETDVWAPVERDFEVHLMVENPGEIFEKWKSRGAKRIIAHNLLPKAGGVEIGLALEMHVPITGEISKADFVQLMSITEIGEQGRPFDERIFDRIREVKERFPDKTVSVDGGINISNYERLIEAGADRLVVGKGFEELWRTLQTKK
jgi:pentose-5-phosphate-3-epimerase